MFSFQLDAPGGRDQLNARDYTNATPSELALSKGFESIHKYLETERARADSCWYLHCILAF